MITGSAWFKIVRERPDAMPWSTEFPGEELESSLESAWLEADRRFPRASVEWDRDHAGDNWIAGRLNMTLVVTPTSLAVGCGDVEPFGWALWNVATDSWIFL